SPVPSTTTSPPLSLHDALPISQLAAVVAAARHVLVEERAHRLGPDDTGIEPLERGAREGKERAGEPGGERHGEPALHAPTDGGWHQVGDCSPQHALGREATHLVLDREAAG